MPRIILHIGYLKGMILSLIAGIFLSSCSESFELNAAYKDIWVVYGVLDQRDTAQYVRVSLAFQVEGDAIEYAAENDLSVKGLSVRLSGNGKTYQAIELPDVPKEPGSGDFLPLSTLYKFRTSGADRLVEGMSYQLEIKRPGTDTLRLEARTRIPPRPDIIFPPLPGSGLEVCLTTIAFEDSLEVRFRKKRLPSLDEAPYFEVKIDFDYQEDGLDNRFVFGPSRLFNNSQGCAGGSGTLCYKIGEGAVLNAMLANLGDTTVSYTYPSMPVCGHPADIPRAVQVYVTAVDTFLSNYMLANDPRFPNLNSYRPEYSNLSGTHEVVGVFGSISFDRVPVSLSGCVQHLLRLNGAFNPTACD
jgi:hypothetical protein